MKIDGNKIEDDDGYTMLANAIILQAVKDYRKAIRKNDTGQIKALNSFFHSGFFATLTKINPDYLIEKLNKEYESKGKKK